MADPTPPPLPSELPVLPLRRTVAFPLTLQPLAVNRPVSIETVNRALGGRPADPAAAAGQRRGRPGARGRAQGRHGRPSSGRWPRSAAGINIILEGLARVRADVVTRTGTSMRAQITPLPETYERTLEVDAHVRRIQELIEKALSLASGLVRGAARRGHEHRGPAAPGLRAGDAARHEAGGQAGAARGERPASRSCRPSPRR